MKKLRKLLSVIIVTAIVMCLIPAQIKAYAATKPGKPKITLESVANGNAVIIKIGKTKNTDAYEIYVKEPGEKEYKEYTTIYKTGKKARTCIIRTPKNGEYGFKVRGVYYAAIGNDVYYGKYSKPRSVKIKAEPKPLSELQTGDYVKFGSYEQDGNMDNGKEAIEWVVLSNEDSKLFLLSKYVLEPGKINAKTDTEVTYENSSLRKWLNGDFFKSVFNADEAGLVATTGLEDVNTEDKVFLLSWNECKTEGYGLMEKMDRRCGATEYSQTAHDVDGDGKKESVDTCLGYEEDNVCRTYDGEDACYWWLRTKEKDDNFMLIGERGGWTATTYYGKKLDSQHRDADGDEKYYVTGFGIRPAIVVELNDNADKLILSTGRNVADQKTITDLEAKMK